MDLIMMYIEEGTHIAQRHKLLYQLTAFLFVACKCLFSRSQFTAVLSTIRRRRIGTGSCKCHYSSSTRHTALRLLPFGVLAVNC